MNRELKLALIVGFAVVLVVAVVISDHLSKARQVVLAGVNSVNPPIAERAVRSTPPATELALEPVAGDPAPEAVKNTESPVDDVLEIKQGMKPASDRLANNSQPKGFRDAINELTGTPPSTGLIRPGQVRNGNGLPETDQLVDPTDAEIKTAALPKGREHTVVEGDTLYRIAKQYYGDASLWQPLAKVNAAKLGSNNSVRPGVKLAIPSAEVLRGGTVARVANDTRLPALVESEPRADRRIAMGETTKPVADATPKAVAAGVKYTVKSGDTLGSIAKRMMGSSTKADELAKANSRVVRDPKALRVGMVLDIPTK